MLEYAFFQDESRRRFIALLQQHGVSWTQETRDPETLVVLDESGLDDPLADRIESFYDELLAAEQALYETDRRRGVHPEKDRLAVRLADGRTLHAQVPAEMLERVLLAISPIELDSLVAAVVATVEGSKP